MADFTDADIGMYWRTLRTFKQKLVAILEDMKEDATWTKPKLGPWGDEEAGEVAADGWTLALESTTNTLAALLKVPVGVNPLMARDIKRADAEDHPRVRLARGLSAHAQSLITEFDKLQ